MKADFPYQRIGPRNSRLTGRDSLWLGADHLLYVHNTRFVETYQRFDLREIQAIVIRRQPRFVIPVWLPFACLFALIVGVSALAGGVRWASSAGFGLWLVLVIAWLTVSVGRSCSFHLQTAVDTYELPGLYRYDASHRVLEVLESRIAEVQGVLPPDWTVDESVDAISYKPARFRPPIPGAAESIAEKPARPASILIPVLACAGFLADALLSWLVRNPAAPRFLHTLSLPVTLIAVVLAVVSVVVTIRDHRFLSIRILFLVAVFGVGIANYGNTLGGAVMGGLQRAGQASLGAAAILNNVLYWLNQVVEIPAGGFGLLILLLGIRRREPTGEAGRRPSVQQVN